MSIYRCAVCGSSRVVPETKQEGYNKKQGILGMALFGLGGAVAGASGNTVVYYHCPACGHTLNRCMPDFEKNNIDKYLLDPNDETNKSMLRMEKKQYPNIEWEEPIKEENNSVGISIRDKQSCTYEEHKQKSEKISPEFEKFLQLEKATEEQQQFLKELQQRQEEEQQESEKYLRRQKAIEEHQQRLKELQQKTEEQRQKAIVEHEQKRKELHQKMEELRPKIDEHQKRQKAIMMAILNALYKAEKPCTLPEMQNIEESCKEYSVHQLAATVRHLLSINIVERFEENKKVYYRVIPKSRDEAIKILWPRDPRGV